MRRGFFWGAAIALVLLECARRLWGEEVLWSLAVVGPLLLLGFFDAFQTKQTVRRNFPLIGRLRYVLESIRPEIQQYFIETDVNGRPFSREQRSVVYQRAKEDLDTVPFGTKHQYQRAGHLWLEHALLPRDVSHTPPTVRVGGPSCTRPYDASLLNVSAMSYGSLSHTAVLALNGAAKDGAFAHNTGEGGVSPYHLEPGGDLIWQLGTGYFGCRTKEGNFCASSFRDRVSHEHIKMVELKLSQGAKPGHGGILPGRKVSPEIAAIRGVQVGKDVRSPPGHSAFSSPKGLVAFVAQLRELAQGKPVGIKLCLGRPVEWLNLCQVMADEKEGPDFIAVDGGEGGTGAAPLEFTNHVGWPLWDSLHLVHASLLGAGLRDRVKLMASGRVVDAFDMAVCFALGADLCSSARAMMIALGCIQALRCNHNNCPTGVATTDRALAAGLVVRDKRLRVTRYQRNTLSQLMHLCGASGVDNPRKLRLEQFRYRTESGRVTSLAERFSGSVGV